MSIYQIESLYNRLHDRLPTDHRPDLIMRRLAVLHRDYPVIVSDLETTRQQAIADGAR
jgi:hypothetical protein